MDCFLQWPNICKGIANLYDENICCPCSLVFIAGVMLAYSLTDADCFSVRVADPPSVPDCRIHPRYSV